MQSDPLSCLLLGLAPLSLAEKPTGSYIQGASGLSSHLLGHSWGAAGPLVSLWLTIPSLGPQTFQLARNSALCHLASILIPLLT